MGARSEAFVRHTLDTLEQDPDILPRSFDLEEMQRDLVALDQLRPIFSRLRQLAGRADDTERALGNDLYESALAAYTASPRPPTAARWPMRCRSMARSASRPTASAARPPKTAPTDTPGAPRGSATPGRPRDGPVRFNPTHPHSNPTRVTFKPT